jgi:hypothetical protein
MSTVKLPVTNSKPTLVDDDIAKKLEGKKLWLSCGKRYIRLSFSGKTIYLHRFVIGNPKGMDIDHIDGNKYDNRRCNLRICNRAENTLNRRKDSKASSGYRNVHKKNNSLIFILKIKRNYKSIHLCTFRSRHIAGIFADQVLVKTVGPFVRRNFQEKVSSSCLYDFLEGTSGRIFRVVFSRRSDGRQREMVCRTGVNSKHSNGTIPFDPASLNLFSVYDVQKRAYRFIPLENVICIRFAKTNYRVVA